MELSIIVPVYRSEACLPELARRVHDAVGPHVADYELILVNDASPDASWQVITSLASSLPSVVGINLRKNVGQDNAIMAGLHHASGEAVVIMDDDLQHDPADVPALCRALRGGFDVAYAAFEHKRQALWKNLGSWFNDRVAVIVLGKPKHVYLSPYKAIRREVVNEIVKYDGPFTYVDGIIFNITSNITQVPATHHARFAGRSNYNLLRSIRVWLKLATGFSVIPLRIATIIGGVISFCSFLAALFFVIQALVLDRIPEGYPSLIVTLFFLGGMQLMGLGAVGEYVGRIFLTQNKTPQFTVKNVVRHTMAGRREAHADRIVEWR
jgi:undecaprenyl-phosphate 4-deoxy-4-formamido-L-arabinose transferase